MHLWDIREYVNACEGRVVVRRQEALAFFCGTVQFTDLVL